MTTIASDPNRHVVPRWRSWRLSAQLGMLDPARAETEPQKPEPRHLQRAEWHWRQNPDLPFAGDFLGVACSLAMPDRAVEAAQSVLSAEASPPRVLRKLAERSLSPVSVQTKWQDPPDLKEEERFARIHLLKVGLRDFPRDALAWLDLAREYAVLGQPEAARRPVSIALALAPHSRLVIRSAARFLLHVGDYARAHEILRNSPRVASDPWLLAAEIAVAGAAKEGTRFGRKARQMLSSGGFQPVHLSELSAAMGTLELESGNRRSGHKLLRKALIDPTENAIAQADWAARRDTSLEIMPGVSSTPCTYEATAWRALAQKEWEGAVRSAWLWFRDEPFASRATAFGSWVAAITIGSDDESARFARAGLRTDPQNPLLLNNLAVALATMGQVDEAAVEFSQIPGPEVTSDITYLATKGLIMYRSGDPEAGRVLYRAAIEEARRKRDKKREVWALLHFAKEEFRFDQDSGDRLLDEGIKLAGELPSSERPVVQRIQELVTEAREAVLSEQVSQR